MRKDGLEAVPPRGWCGFMVRISEDSGIEVMPDFITLSFYLIRDKSFLSSDIILKKCVEFLWYE